MFRFVRMKRRKKSSSIRDMPGEEMAWYLSKLLIIWRKIRILFFRLLHANKMKSGSPLLGIGDLQQKQCFLKKKILLWFLSKTDMLTECMTQLSLTLCFQAAKRRFIWVVKSPFCKCFGLWINHFSNEDNNLLLVTCQPVCAFSEPAA